MRIVILALAVTATACAKEQPAAPVLATGAFAGGGRDGLCISGPAGAQRAGFIVYGAGNANCSASGRIEPAGASWTLIPAGDAECKIPLSVDGATISFGPASPGCAYYCGPGTTYAGKSFSRTPATSPVTDLAGDPLC